MKISVKKELLLGAIQKVQNVITPKTTLPILSHIMLETKRDTLTLVATDLDIGISCEIPVNVQEAGAITIAAKRFGEIIKELSEEEILISTKKNNLVNIETEKCQFKIMGLGKEEFPKLPEFQDKEVLKIDQALLKEMIGLTHFAVSFDETRYILNGILFKINKDTITLVSTDGKRLAIITRKLLAQMDGEINVIVPVKTIHELNRNLSENGQVSIIVSHNQILFDFDRLVIISRLIEGEFPAFGQVIPEASPNKIKVSRQALLLATRRAALLATVDYQAVKLEIFKNKLVISKSTPDIGESREELLVEYHGKEISIGFNPAYLIDVLKNLQVETVEVEVTDTEKPAVIRIDGYIYIVLPMRLG